MRFVARATVSSFSPAGATHSSAPLAAAAHSVRAGTDRARGDDGGQPPAVATYPDGVRR
jgi:hypothetical protein